MTLLTGKRAIVTGGSRGIGRGISVELARQGCDVVIGYHVANDEDYGRDRAIEDVVAEIAALGRRAIAVEGDIADPKVAQRLVAAAVDNFGGVDVLSSNAGICPFHAFLDMPLETYQQTVAVNLNGAFYVSQAAANRMKSQGTGGAIIATSSISALVGGAMQTHYTPTKAGVHSLMQSAAIALGPYGIRCNSVMPGAIATDLNKDDWSDPEKRAYLDKRIPLGRFGTPEDVGKVVAFLASDMAAYVTGAALLVDGGLFVNLQ
ncbi:SDR family NAD(P)-dependent oxidoreductase [Devosia nitrariae]|uniref:3-ketoacyl-ACP reductase n=1 Tax=Devosia nitrariae TaxID=2071872 RepID=A0ABQ5W3H0_9HYPH|nr:glucose 1-dehydrogenase [Devosia nitrariae]GLQ54278.1 3-ketoacyl-ACP reductase [Devosia nitrariae]